MKNNRILLFLMVSIFFLYACKKETVKIIEVPTGSSAINKLLLNDHPWHYTSLIADSVYDLNMDNIGHQDILLEMDSCARNYYYHFQPDQYLSYGIGALPQSCGGPWLDCIGQWGWYPDGSDSLYFGSNTAVCTSLSPGIFVMEYSDYYGAVSHPIKVRATFVPY